VATTYILPIYAKISRKLLRKTASRQVGDTEIVEGFDRFWLSLRCPSHAWSWPRANNRERFEGFDSHQTCHKCTSHRMFNTSSWNAGPVYRQRGENC
jgi:hypothetical protein